MRNPTVHALILVAFIVGCGIFVVPYQFIVKHAMKLWNGTLAVIGIILMLTGVIFVPNDDE